MDLEEHPDWALIVNLGGPAKVARLLNLEDGGVQRIQNWKFRGIPAAMKLHHPELFLPNGLGTAPQAEAAAPAPAPTPEA